MSSPTSNPGHTDNTETAQEQHPNHDKVGVVMGWSGLKMLILYHDKWIINTNSILCTDTYMHQLVDKKNITWNKVIT